MLKSTNNLGICTGCVARKIYEDECKEIDERNMKLGWDETEEDYPSSPCCFCALNDFGYI